jgi:hypothetical protein
MYSIQDERGATKRYLANGKPADSIERGTSEIGKRKGEFLLPIMTRESAREDAQLFIEAMPQLPCKVTGGFVGGKIITLEEPFECVPGQFARLPLPQGTDPSSPVGLFTLIERGMNPWAPAPKAWKLPMGARIVRERVPEKITLAPSVLALSSTGVQAGSSSSREDFSEMGANEKGPDPISLARRIGASTTIVQWQPEVPCRFKRFAFEVSGDAGKIVMNDFRYGKDSLFLSSEPLPLSVVMSEGAFGIPDVVSPGILVTMSLSNLGAEEATISGGIVFEAVPEEELRAMQKEWEERQQKFQKDLEERLTHQGKSEEVI